MAFRYSTQEASHGELTYQFSPECRKKVMHRGWAYFQARLAFTIAAFNILVQWHGLQPYASGFVPLSMAELSL